MFNPKQSPLFQKLLELELSPNDYAVFGSGPMFAYGLREQFMILI